MTTAWMHPLARLSRVLSDRLAALEKDVPKDPHDVEGWADYMQTARLLVDCEAARKAPVPAVVVRDGHSVAGMSPAARAR